MYQLKSLDDTIAAIATPLGEGGIGIVRLSGKEAVAIDLKRSEGRELDPLLLEADGAVVVDGRVSVERLEEALEAELAVDEEGIDTVGGLVTSIFGRIPQVGERASHQGFEVEVLDAEEKRVNRARFRRVPVPDPA